MDKQNQAWTINDEMIMLHMAEHGYSFVDMRKELGRTAMGVQSKLSKLLITKNYHQLEWLAKEPE